MPRQLPWLSKGGGSRTQVKAPPKPARKSRIQSDIDDDFFEGTVLASSRKGKETESRESDDELPELPNKYAQTSRKGKEPASRSRLPSSSPPPASAVLPPPPTEYMHKCVDKFDLRDDEWMMVEDEFLQTAKLFTQHLHLEEYRRLKKRMDEQKKVVAARSVVPDAKPSVEAQCKNKARDQVKAQQKALKDVFSSANAGNDNDEDARRRTTSSKVYSSHVSHHASSAAANKDRQRAARLSNTSGSDSDDLDAPTRPTRGTNGTATTKSSTFHTASILPSNTFAKPAVPADTRPRPSRFNRPTPFDMWDDEFATKRSSLPPKAPIAKTSRRAPSPTKSTMSSVSKRSASPSKSSHASTTRPSPSPKKLGGSLDLDDFDMPKRDFLAKRKADTEKADKKKPKYDDTIPTFLF